METHAEAHRVSEIGRNASGGGIAPDDVIAHAEMHLAAGDADTAVDVLRSFAPSRAAFRSCLAASRLLRQLGERDADLQRRRIAVAATSTVDQLVSLLDLAGLHVGLRLVAETCGFGQYETAALDPASPLLRNDVDAIVLIPDARAVALPAIADDPVASVAAEIDRLRALWFAIRRHTAAPILQVNIPPPLERPLGDLEASVDGARRRAYAMLNDGLAVDRPVGVDLVDASSLAFEFGLERWWDDKFWFAAKQAVSLAAVPRLASAIAGRLSAVFGRSRKCLVVDLDNTLWGGVVGDDGVENLQLEGTPVGEAHLALQQQIRELGQTGIVLAVCSKNDVAVARRPFETRNDMVLGLDDFAVFVANWEPKPVNLTSIADQLDLGVESLVFLDDNPAERELVRQQLPMIDVIELPPDPANYRRTLAAYRGFDRTSLTIEDRHRTAQYRARADAQELRRTAASLDDFLESLEMRVDLRPFDTLTLPRVGQLINKTNQWNLTTRRHGDAALQAFAESPEHVCFSARLIDRFADHGIVAVVVAAVEDDALEIDTLLMSCRVIGRTLEHVLIDRLVDEARRRGRHRVLGVYERSPKNSLVEGVFGTVGFRLSESDERGSRWLLDLDGDHSPGLNQFIEVM